MARLHFWYAFEKAVALHQSEVGDRVRTDRQTERLMRECGHFLQEDEGVKIRGIFAETYELIIQPPCQGGTPVTPEDPLPQKDGESCQS